MNIAVILSGGIGSRMRSNIPKQYLMVLDHPIIYYSVEKFIKHPKIDFIIIASNNEWKNFIRGHLPEGGNKIFFSNPGETREHTIYNALLKCKELGGTDEDIVIIHDAVRPLVTNDVINRCLDGCSIYDASIATIDVKDTIYVCTRGECITNVPNRSNLHAGQTPEAFRLGKFLKIHEEASYDDISNVTGGAQFASQKGLSVFLAKGDEINFKITTPSDLERFEQIMKNRTL